MDTSSALPLKIGKYEVLGVIGKGGMGVVYSARDPYIDRIVAIKTIRMAEGDCDDDQIGRLRMEARSAGKLHHPNIVTIYDFGEEGELSYIVMELVEGINLSRVVQKRKAVPLASKLDLIMQVARGLSYAHECGVVHRDLKPSNICITARGVAKVLDFGLARFDNTRLTKTGYLSGTIAYMSPERFSGESGPQDDIFALGAVAYELLTYRRAFPGDTTPQIIGKILGGPMPEPISEQTPYPPELDAIMFRALQRDPADRFATAADFEKALGGFIHSDPYRTFVAEEANQPDFQEAVEWNEENVHSAASPYSSGRSMSSIPIGKTPTLQIPSENAEATTGTDIMLPAGTPHGEPTLLTTKPVGKPGKPDMKTHPAIDPRAGQLDKTEVVAPQPRKKSGWIAAAVIASIVVIAAAVISRKDRSPEPPAVTRAVVTAPPVSTTAAPNDDQAWRQSEVQLATATTLANLVAQRPLTADEKSRFAEANGRLEQARSRIAQKDYATGAALAQQAGDTLRDLLSTKGAPAQTARKPAPTKTPVKKTVVVAAGPVAAAPVKTPPPPTQTVAAPPPVVIAPPPHVEPAAPRPARAELEREINSFMREMAAAYQSKDVEFFRERSLRYSESFGAAIRNSPSTRVDIAVRSIQFADDQNATVVVRRTDTFAEAGMSPGVQTLTYELRRQPDGWKIVRFMRG